MRSRSFDPDAARQAWRQFARGRGAHAGPALAPRPSLLPWVAGLVCVAVLGGGWWLASRPAAKPDGPSTLVVASSVAPSSTKPASVDAPAAPIAAVVDEAPSRPVYAGAAPAPAVLPAAADVPEIVADTPVVAAARPVARTITPNARRIPIGISADNERALRKLPVAKGDADPVGGVGEAGIHVDDIELGTGHVRGVCSGPDRGFSLARERSIDVCLRVVHARQAQQVTVLWERAGVLVRRVRITIPATHAHRTRAGLPLRPDAPGRWRVRVLSEDDVELAALDFSVAR